MRRILLAALALLLAAAPLSAQKKAETKLYDKTLAKPSVAAFDKFLKKYPSSVYAEDILARRDTLLNITPYDMAQAAAIAAPLLPEDTEFLAIADRREAVDRIYAVCLGGPEMLISLDVVRIVSFRKEAGGWVQESFYDAPAAPEGDAAYRYFTDSASVITIRDTRYLRFNYVLDDLYGTEQTYVAAAYAPQTDDFGCVSFCGLNVLPSGDPAPYRISGRINEVALTGMERPFMRLMLNDVRNNPNLDEIPENFYLTDAAIQWWLDVNAETISGGSTHLRFNILPENCSLVEEYTKAKGKKNSSKYTAAMFDHRGYTVIVAYQKEDKNYVLAWAEVECADHYRDRLLNSISFDDANTLEMAYYHGNRTFKYHLNLTSKTLRRS